MLRSFFRVHQAVIDLPPWRIEEIFHVGGDVGSPTRCLAAQRHPARKVVRLNMGGAFRYTNKESLSLGLVLPADHCTPVWRATRTSYRCGLVFSRFTSRIVLDGSFLWSQRAALIPENDATKKRR